LVELFGGSWPSTPSLEDQLKDLVAFSTIWDHRAGRLRLEIAQDGYDATQSRVVYEIADDLGLVSQQASSGVPATYVVVLGGLATGTWARVQYCSVLLHQRVLRPGLAVVLLGNFRRLRSEEIDFLRTREPALATATTEVDLLERTADLLLPSSEPWHRIAEGDPKVDPRRAVLHSWRGENTPVHVFAAASSDPQNRPANTADTLLLAATEMPFLSGQYVQFVTSGIYAVYQFFDAIRVVGVPYGVSVEVVGLPPQSSVRVQSTAALVQEVRSCLLSGLALLQGTGRGDGGVRNEFSRPDPTARQG